MSLGMLQGRLSKGKVTVAEKHKTDESWRGKGSNRAEKRSEFRVTNIL